ncbi:larval cuticle protein 1-like isoform X2 [Anoplophora glabripennis]|nr:larval cuticle protein 1-like isoform X2 [Anoplophora glabripennis]
MEPFVLKIAVLIFFICFNIITLSKSAPVGEQYRTTLAEWTDYNAFEPQGPGTYSFGYDIEDPEKDNIQFRDEERFPNGTIKGSYGYLRPDGMVQIVHYTADENGYRAKFESYPRGQLKPLRNTNKINEEPLSSALRAAIQSKNVFKRQHVHEQRLR